MSSPSQNLAQIIIEKLIAENLILAEDEKRLLPKLAEGKLRTEDWRLAIEKATDKEEQE